MKYYEVIVATALTGTFHLTDAQYAGRKHILGPTPSKDGRYTSHTPLNFKKGEILGFDGAVAKGTAPLEPVDVDFDKLIKADRDARAEVRRKALEARAPRPKAKAPASAGLFGKPA